jgi:predicted nucleic acid-binding protein
VAPPASLASAVSERLLAADALHAPNLPAVEVTQVVRRYVAAGELGEARGAEALVELADLDVIHHPHEPLLPVMWRLRSDLTAYDAAYLAVAEVLDRSLVTLDPARARAPGHGAVVDLVAPAVPPASAR